MQHGINETNNFEKLLDEMSRFTPAEIIANDLLYESTEEISKIRERFGLYISEVKDEAFSNDIQNIISNYEIVTVSGEKVEKIEDKLLIVSAINGLLDYLNQTQKIKLEHINKIQIYNTNRYMALDINARRNLEITEKMRDKTKKGTLLWVLDKTKTSMGGRMLRRFLNDPLIDKLEIEKRLDAVEELKNNIMLKGEIIENLKKVYDIERLIGKISYGNANARDMISLKNSLINLPSLKATLSKFSSKYIQKLNNNLDQLTDIAELIEEAIVEEPPITIKEGGIIKTGYKEEIDEYRKASTDGKKWVIELEAKERELTRN